MQPMTEVVKMCDDCLGRIRDLPLYARRRAESFVEEGKYYGWKLKSVEAKRIGDLLLCTLNFDLTRIVFVARVDGLAIYRSNLAGLSA
jgi:hypothetical protein